MDLTILWGDKFRGLTATGKKNGSFQSFKHFLVLLIFFRSLVPRCHLPIQLPPSLLIIGLFRRSSRIALRPPRNVVIHSCIAANKSPNAIPMSETPTATRSNSLLFLAPSPSWLSSTYSVSASAHSAPLPMPETKRTERRERASISPGRWTAPARAVPWRTGESLSRAKVSTTQRLLTWSLRRRRLKTSMRWEAMTFSEGLASRRNTASSSGSKWCPSRWRTAPSARSKCPTLPATDTWPSSPSPARKWASFWSTEVAPRRAGSSGSGVSEMGRRISPY